MTAFESRRRPLSAFFAPQTIAVIAATETDNSVGRAIMTNLRSSKGKVYPVNSKHEQVFGMKAWPTIAAVPEPVDLALIATPAATAEPDPGIAGSGQSAFDQVPDQPPRRPFVVLLNTGAIDRAIDFEQLAQPN